MTFNINDKVKVRLTEHGHSILKSRYDELTSGMPIFKSNYPFQRPEEDSDGWSEWPLWDLMYQFGKHTYDGSGLPFHADIRIDDKDLRSEADVASKA